MFLFEFENSRITKTIFESIYNRSLFRPDIFQIHQHLDEKSNNLNEFFQKMLKQVSNYFKLTNENDI